MRGYWIPWEVGLEKKREIIVISRHMGVSVLEAASMCMMVWVWAQGESVDGLIPNLTIDDVSLAVGIQGIGKAMAAAGWIVESEGCIQFPNWERFNGRPAKARLIDAERKRKERKARSR